MKTKFILLPVTIVILGSLSSCAKEKASEVDQSRIYTAYSADYDDGARAVTATATFYFGGPGGTYLLLDGSSRVTIEGAMSSEETNFANQVIYHHNWSQALTGGGDVHFVYTNNNGKTFSNTGSIPATVYGTYQPSSSPRQLTVQWTSLDSVTGDSLRVEIQKPDGSSAGVSSLSLSDASGTMGVATFGAESLSKLLAGSYQMRICRTRSASLTEKTDVGGSFWLGACSTRSNVSWYGL